jgi:DNA invertase Pin-like site-specific DNA recombinase
MRAALYLRVSLDATGEQLAVTRQREDCRRIAEARGWRIVAEYSDTISASYPHKLRPDYRKLVEAYQAGMFDALVCWDLDRLTRQPRELEDWIDAAESKGLVLVTANGEADLSTDGGRMFARIKAAVARAEIERKSARQRRAALQRSQMGKPPMGVRLTGYTVSGEVIEAEAEYVRNYLRGSLKGTRYGHWRPGCKNPVSPRAMATNGIPRPSGRSCSTHAMRDGRFTKAKSPVIKAGGKRWLTRRPLILYKPG